MDGEEANAIRDRALSAHIEMGKRQLAEMQERVNKLMQECELVAREVTAMEEARAVLSEGPPATDSSVELEPEVEAEEATEAG